MNSYYYINTNTGYFAKISDRELADPSLTRVETLPPDGQHKWDGQRWVALTSEEIMVDIPVEERTGIVETSIATPVVTRENAIAIWQDTKGETLIDSPLIVGSNEVKIPVSLNLIGETEYRLNGRSIKERDRQIAIAHDRQDYSSSSWQRIPDLLLTTNNLTRSLYRIEIELLLQVNRNSRDFEVALFLDGQQQIVDSLELEFNRKEDSKPVYWSNDYELDPGTTVAVYWRRVGSSVTCYCDRRKLRIEENWLY